MIGNDAAVKPRTRGLRNQYRTVGFLGILLSALGAGPSRAQPLMESAPAGIVEAGTPAFVVQGADAIGLSTPIVDLQKLADGRMLVVAQRELALGDGVRWDVHPAREGEELLLGAVAIGEHGELYTTSKQGFAEIVFGDDGRWSRRLVQSYPKSLEDAGSRITSADMLPAGWYWHGPGGAIVTWKPGMTPKIEGEVGSIGRMFELGTTVYVSSQSSGALYRLDGAGNTLLVLGATMVASEAILATVPLTPTSLLVGTNGEGLKIFGPDGIHPVQGSPLLQEGQIVDVVAAGERTFAVGVDNVGIAVVDEKGNLIQALDHTLDHRLSRVRRLHFTKDGVLWALLNDSIARMEFPSRVTNFEPLVAGGLAFAQPMRYDGKLWVLADGRALRGVYSSGRLVRFEPDSPPGKYGFMLTVIDGRLLATNDAGIFERDATGWRRLADQRNARIGLSKPVDGRWIYASLGEMGWMRMTSDGMTLEPFPAPKLDNIYDAITDGEGVVWLEMGAGLIGRIAPGRTAPELRQFTQADGLTDGWSQGSNLNGVVRFNLNNQILRYDAAKGTFFDDVAFKAAFPELGNTPGRPAYDALGRLWFSTRGNANFLSIEGGKRTVETVDVGFEPSKYTMEKNGVVWMWANQRFARYDPRLPPEVESVPVAMVTSVQLPESRKYIYNPSRRLEELAYADNSPVFHFIAPGGALDATTFEVLIEGAGTQWLKIGGVGLFALNRLKEGSYVFHVRPIKGAVVGTEASVAFTISPPWYRSSIAWITYALAVLALITGIAWFSSFLERREKERLAKLVEERTGELQTQVRETVEKATALAASEERFRALNSVLERRVLERTAEVAYERDLLRALLESSPDKIYFKDLQSRFIKCSVALAKSFNVSSVADVIGKTDADFLAPSYAEPALKDEKKIIETGCSIIAKTEKEVWLDGRISWVLTSKIPLRDSHGLVAGTIGVSRDITELKEAEAKLVEVNKQLLQTSHQAGMAEVATSVLHNVGNVLNSVNVSTTLVSEQIKGSKVAFVRKVADLLESNAPDLGGFLTRDPRGMKLGPYLSTLSDSLIDEQKKMTEELQHLRKQVEHIKEIVAMQQNFAKVSGVAEAVSVVELVEDAIRINSSSLTRHEVEIVRDFQAKPTLNIERHKVMQVLVNLIRNAKQACDASGGTDKKIIVRITETAGRVGIAIVDNGVGIPAENIARIFAHGFSTKKDGHGFGLHSAALSAKELHGTLMAESDGIGRGATFVLDLPIDGAAA